MEYSGSYKLAFMVAGIPIIFGAILLSFIPWAQRTGNSTNEMVAAVDDDYIDTMSMHFDDGRQSCMSRPINIPGAGDNESAVLSQVLPELNPRGSFIIVDLETRRVTAYRHGSVCASEDTRSRALTPAISILTQTGHDAVSRSTDVDAPQAHHESAALVEKAINILQHGPSIVSVQELPQTASTCDGPNRPGIMSVSRNRYVSRDVSRQSVADRHVAFSLPGDEQRMPVQGCISAIDSPPNATAPPQNQMRLQNTRSHQANALNAPVPPPTTSVGNQQRVSIGFFAKTSQTNTTKETPRTSGAPLGGTSSHHELQSYLNSIPGSPTFLPGLNGSEHTSVHTSSSEHSAGSQAPVFHMSDESLNRERTPSPSQAESRSSQEGSDSRLPPRDVNHQLRRRESKS